jgi:hypothetical protein
MLERELELVLKDVIYCPEGRIIYSWRDNVILLVSTDVDISRARDYTEYDRHADYAGDLYTDGDHYYLICRQTKGVGP